VHSLVVRPEVIMKTLRLLVRARLRKEGIEL
jgi:hypothetical protein